MRGDYLKYLSPTAVLVDRLKLNVHKFGVKDLSYSDFLRLVVLMKESDYSQSMSSTFFSQFRLRKPTPIDVTCRLKYDASCSTSWTDIRLYIELNPTRLLRQPLTKQDLGEEISLNKDNWLPMGWVEEKGTSLVRSLMAKAIEDRVGRVLACFYGFLEGIGVDIDNQVFGPQYSVSSIEAYHHIPCPRPIPFVTDLEAPFLALFREVEQADYRVPSSGKEYNSPCLKGSSKKNFKIKIYAKTNKAVRVEFVAAKKYLQRYHNGNSIQPPLGASVMQVATSVAEAGLKMLSPLFAQCPVPGEPGDPIVLIHKIHKACPDGMTAQLIVDELGYSGGILSWYAIPVEFFGSILC